MAFRANCLGLHEMSKNISGKNMKNISICHLLKILPGVLSINMLFLDLKKKKKKLMVVCNFFKADKTNYETKTKSHRLFVLIHL